MLVFVHINKTAGSTVRFILRSSYGARHCDVEPWKGTEDERPFTTRDLRRLRKLYRNLASIAGHRVVGYVDLEDDVGEFHYVTLLRDPLKLTASRFQYHVDHRKKQGLVFEEWIQREWLRNAQTKRIAGTVSADDAIRVIERKNIFVGLTERFDESMVLLKGLRAPDLNIAYQPMNVARRNVLASELLATSETRRLLIDANREDLAVYSYVRETLYPRLQHEYGPGLDVAVAEYERAKGGWSRRRLLASRVKRHTVYRPLLSIYRSGLLGRGLERVLA
jgi:hypothetical protein